MTSDNNLFDLSTSLLPQYDDTGQPRPPVHPMQQHYSESWNSLALNSPYLLSPQDGPWSYHASSFPAQDAGNRSQRTQNAQDTLLDLGPLSPNRDAANKVDMQSLLKPAAEGWRPPFLPRPYDGTEGYQNNTYTRSTGVMSEPLGTKMPTASSEAILHQLMILASILGNKTPRDPHSVKKRLRKIVLRSPR